LIVDGWIKLAVPQDLQVPVLKMRQRLDALLDSWVAERDHDSAAVQHNLMNERGGAELLKAIVEILSSQEETPPLPAPLNKQQLEQEQARWKKAQKAQKALGGGSKKKNGGGGWGCGGGGSTQQTKRGGALGVGGGGGKKNGAGGSRGWWR